MSQVIRVCVEKKPGFDVEAKAALKDLRESLHMEKIESVRVLHVYDIEGLDKTKLEPVKSEVLSEPNVDFVYDGIPSINAGDKVFRTRLLTGQFDQRADSAQQCIELITMKERPHVQASTLYIISGPIGDDDFDQIKNYLINPVEACEVKLEKPEKLTEADPVVEAVDHLETFNGLSSDEMEKFRQEHGFAMTLNDLMHCQNYFKDDAKRVPTITELKVIDTYWSDHCRHTTFMTEIKDVKIEKRSPDCPCGKYIQQI